MAAALDLTGRRFGRLTVLRKAGTVVFGRKQSAWACLCDCGREEVLPLDKLTKRGYIECAVCRQGNCVVCSKPIPLDRGHRKTCSDECAVLQTRATQLDHYYRRIAADPDLNRKKHARAAQRIAADPERKQALAEKDRARNVARWEAVKADPALHDAQRARVASWYAAKAQEVQARRSGRVATLDAAAYERWAERVRGYQRAYRARWRDDLVAHPERHQQYLDLQREYRRQAALRKLMATGQILMDRTDK